MKPTFLKGALVGGIAGAIMAAGTVALAGTGIGDVFNLGQSNTVNASSGLSGSVAAPQLKVTNTNGGGTGVRAVHAASSGSGAGVQGDTSSSGSGATGVAGSAASSSAAGDSNGVKGLNNGAGRGVYGQSSSGPGVYGNSNTGYGVWGIGSYGLVGGGSQGGVWATTANSSGAGVYGQNTGAGKGVSGQGPIGVYGAHSATTGTGAGVFGETNSADAGATGILARANATNAGRDNVALRAINNNTNQYGMGVWASIAGSGWGVLGESGANGIGVIGKLAGTGTGVYGLTGSGGVGVRGVGGKTGVYGQATDGGGYAFAANGDAGQNRSSGGWVKAMAYVNPNYPAGQQVRRCFNSQVAPGTPYCGITAEGVSVGNWYVDFGFDVSDRFLSVTPTPAFRGGGAGLAVASACTYPCATEASKATVEIVYSGSGEDTNTPFFIIVY